MNETIDDLLHRVRQRWPTSSIAMFYKPERPNPWDVYVTEYGADYVTRHAVLHPTLEDALRKVLNG